MADEERTALDRVRDRLGDLERVSDRMDERIAGMGRDKLGKDDAQRLMAFSTDGDEKLRADVVERLNSFRIEVREAFKHNERETEAAIYKAVQESENRVTTAINALAATFNAAPASDQKRGWHPAAAGLGGAGAGASILYLVLAFLNMVPRPGG